MTIDPREIAAVLNASEAVREALRRVGGVGYYLGSTVDSGHTLWPYDPRVIGPWLPLDAVAIVQEAVRIAGGDGWTLTRGGTNSFGILTQVWRDSFVLMGARGETPHLAAIELLRKVLEKP